MKTVTIKLDDPIKVAGEEKTELEFRKPTVKDIRIANAQKKDDLLEQSILLIGALSGLSPEDMDQISFSDLNKINEGLATAGFLPEPKNS
ncbi:MAG: phage tail assembly protein [Kiritimatiellales bacterium]